ncbi:MAG: tryptophan--tRNA ligase [Candidatus Magasanikbacteria bacterium CG_4_9_14_3_um_filter_32_9]|uniref:Tryptophan--tRNA ligase n=1 Tax=Candidatus Magasanikbacteria bacterium CG_4_9_14_3_um_filter_32_9 TaxID=1974644 RepID=A0A2M7Z6R7_9BACT|nr:MAG: tryptophan--tRNA ligase [Candidatus Magasanikbacteria bacterium CG_4_9_14_3_um_filter_32_9]
MSKEIIVSAVQPTGNLHVGNYLGAVKNWVELQNTGRYDMYIFIADLHSLTGDMSAEDRKEQILKTAVELLAVGIDPDKTTFFVQSHVVGSAELGWIFNCITPIAELERMTQFKDKSAKQNKNINSGLFTYPTLMAADILLYGANKVPVGNDQIQHLELTRKIGRWFNNRFGDYFAEVQDLLTETPKVMSLLDPTKKMSKSAGLGHVIELADEPNIIENKIKKAVTASSGGGKSLGVDNLFTLVENFGDKNELKKFKQAEKDSTIKYSELKKLTSDSINEYFSDFRKKREELLMDRDKIAEILIKGAEKAQPKATQTLEEVKKLVGIA